MINRIAKINFFTTALIILFSVTLFFTCMPGALDPSPMSNNYPADGYHFTLSLDSLADTLYTFVPYTLPWKDVGRDEHWSFRIVDADSGVIDTTGFHVPETGAGDSLLSLYFLDDYTGTVTIEGIQRNLKPSHDTSFTVTVVNRFAVAVDSATIGSEQDVEFFMDVKKDFPTDSNLSVLWFIDGDQVDSAGLSETFVKTTATAEDFVVSAAIVDRKGNRYMLDTLSFAIRPPGTPTVSFYDETISVPVATPYLLTVSASHADSIRWQSKGLGVDTTITAFSISLTWSESQTDTVIVTALNAYGDEGTRDTLIITPQEFIYSLNIITFPDSAQARNWTVWEVQATENEMPVDGNDVTYIWAVSGDNSQDSARQNGGKYQLYVENEKQFFLSVYAVIGSDTTYRKTTTVAVTANRPVLSVSEHELTTIVNEAVFILIEASSTNQSVSISNVLYLNDSEAATELTTDTLSLVYATPGDKVVKVWAVDDPGFVSDTAIIIIHVTSEKPYFQREQIDTSVYIHDRIRVDGTALAGNEGDSIVSWKWDVDNNGSWDKTTDSAYLDTNFSTVGERTIRIWCANGTGDSSETIATRIITVLAGTPVVDSAELQSTVVYINKNVGLRIFTHDTNGIIKKLQVSWGQGSPLLIATNNGVVDTTLELTFSASGKYSFTVTAVDDDNQVSDVYTLLDTLIVDQGTPHLDSTSLDTAWYNVETLFAIVANDNGSITGYAVSYDNAAFSDWSSDSAFTKAFSDSGWQYVYVKVRDDDNNESAVLKDSVFVKVGYPAIDGVLLSAAEDSIFVEDVISFTITASDPTKSVAKIYANWDGGNEAQDSAVSDSVVFVHTFGVADSGLNRVVFWCVNEDGFLSEDTVINLTVRVGKPVLTSVSRDSASVYINDLITFTAFFSDTNGAVSKAIVDWDSDGNADDSLSINNSDEASFSKIFTMDEAGSKNVSYWVLDDDGIVSEVYSDTFTVKLGIPTFSGISTDSETIYILDSVIYTCHGSDVNDYIDSVFFSWDGDTVFEERVAASSDSAGAFYVFTRADSGSKQMRLRLQDIDGLTNDSVYTIRVQSGAPSVDSLNVDTCWVFDENWYEIYVSDVNGSVDSFEISFDTATSWFGADRAKFEHGWDTSSAGLQEVHVRVMDDDSIWTNKTFQVVVKLGRPIVSLADFGDSIQIAPGAEGELDTMFYVYKGRTPTLAVDTTDSNGQCVEFYWDFDNDGLDYTGNTPNWNQGFQRNVAFDLKVWCQDDDSLESEPLICKVFADEPPVKPQAGVSLSQPGMPDVKIEFRNLDVKDDSLTQFIILIGTSETELTDTVLTDTPANSELISKDGSWMNYTFNPQDFGYTSDFYYMVIAKDARGSTVKCNENGLSIRYPY